jgi:hypothetical protein
VGCFEKGKSGLSIGRRPKELRFYQSKNGQPSAMGRIIGTKIGRRVLNGHLYQAPSLKPDRSMRNYWMDNRVEPTGG